MRAASHLLASGAATSAPSNTHNQAQRPAVAIGPNCALLAPESASAIGCRSRLQCRRRRQRPTSAVVVSASSASNDDAGFAPTKEEKSPVPESITFQRTRGEASSSAPSSSSSSPPSGEEQEGDPFRAGDLVDGRYRVESVLGRGALGVTFAVRDEEATGTGEAKLELALKATRLRGRGAGGAVGGGWKAYDLAEREAAALESLSGHPNIPRFERFFDVDRPDDRVRCLVEERVREGRPLSAVVASGERASNVQVARMARDILRALSHLASRSPPVTHRDVKPENIVLEGGGWGGGGDKAFLVDFSGVAAAALAATESGDSSSASSSSASMPGPGTTVIGTFGFMAPEQFRGAASPASDVYALGATLLFALTGRQPSSFPLRKGLRLDVSAALEAARAPRLLRELVESFLEPSAEDRPTADEALMALEEALAEEEEAEEEEEEEEGVVLSGRAFGGGKKSGGGRSGLGLERRLSSPSAPSSLVSPSSEGGSSNLAAASSSPSSSISLTKPPPGAHSKISTRGENFFAVDVPAGPLLAPERAGSAAFAVVWTASVAAWTVTALAAGSLLAAAFSIPFWLSGAAVAKDALGGSLSGDARLEITPRTWRLVTGKRKKKRGKTGSFENDDDEEDEYDLSGAMEDDNEERSGGGNGKAVGGATSTLRGARVAVTSYVNGVPRTRLEIVDGFNVHVLSEDLSVPEQRWLSRAINAAVERATGKKPSLAQKKKKKKKRSGEDDSDSDDDLDPPPMPPRVFISDSTWGPSGFGAGGMWGGDFGTGDDRFISGGGGGGGFFGGGGGTDRGGFVDDDF